MEGLTLKLKLQYFGHLKRRGNSLEKTLMLEKIETGGEGDHSGRDLEQTPGEREGQESLECCSPWGHKELDTT